MSEQVHTCSVMVYVCGNYYSFPVISCCDVIICARISEHVLNEFLVGE